VLPSTRPGEQPESRDARVGAANVMAPNWPHSGQPHPLPRRERAARADADHRWSRPRRWAIAAASPRPATPSLARILETWMLAVFGVMNSAWPICRLVRPAATLPRPWPTTHKPKRCARHEHLDNRSTDAVLAWSPVAAPSSSRVPAARTAMPARAQPTVSHARGSGQRPASASANSSCWQEGATWEDRVVGPVDLGSAPEVRADTLAVPSPSKAASRRRARCTTNMPD
jgi:hypothetical protein